MCIRDRAEKVVSQKVLMDKTLKLGVGEHVDTEFITEVLVLYSLVGFILPLTCRLKDKWIFALACLLLIQPLPDVYKRQAECLAT